MQEASQFLLIRCVWLRVTEVVFCESVNSVGRGEWEIGRFDAAGWGLPRLGKARQCGAYEHGLLPTTTPQYIDINSTQYLT